MINKILPTGTLLISKPFIMDTYFKRSVVLIAESEDTGDIGFILNKPTDLSINYALEDFPDFDDVLYFGGPLMTDTVHFIHTISELEGCKTLVDGIYWGGNLDQLKEMVENKSIKPEYNNIRFFAGYCNWEPKQLEKEFKKKSIWYHKKGSKKFILNDTPEELWGEVLKSMGNKYSILANFPEDPCLN